MTKLRQCGFTLIELIIFIVVVSVGIAGILSVMNTVVKSSADPMVRKQAMALAESILEEIMLKEYCDPNSVEIGTDAIQIRPLVCYCDPDLTLTPVALTPTFRCTRIPQLRNVAEQEGIRADYDDVEDYNGQTKAVFLDWPSNLSTYSVLITVGTPAPVSGVPMKQVTVAVTGGGNTISLSGYRANY
jgi:MSHA pilin protein MshD